MNISVSRYIASENLQGVQALARQLKLPVPNNDTQAKNLLDALYHRDAEKATAIFIDLHPDKDLLGAPSYENMIKEPLKPEENPNNMRNATGGCGCMHNAMEQQIAGNMQNYADKTVETAKDIFNVTSEKVTEKVKELKDIIKEKDDQNFKRIAIFVGGAVVGGLIVKAIF